MCSFKSFGEIMYSTTHTYTISGKRLHFDRMIVVLDNCIHTNLGFFSYLKSFNHLSIINNNYNLQIGNNFQLNPYCNPPYCIQLYKGFPWFTGWYWPIRFDSTIVPYGDSCQSGLTLQLFPLETIVTSNLIGQNKRIVQWKCFIQLGADVSGSLRC